MSETISRDWLTYRIEFVMAPNPHPVDYPETVGLGWAVEQICYRGADFAPLFNFEEDGVVKVRARSMSFPAWEATEKYNATKRDLLKWLPMVGWVLEDYNLVKTDELFRDSCAKRGLPVPDCCKVYTVEETDPPQKIKLTPWGYCTDTLNKNEAFCKANEVHESVIKESVWPKKETITATYRTFPKFT